MKIKKLATTYLLLNLTLLYKVRKKHYKFLQFHVFAFALWLFSSGPDVELRHCTIEYRDDEQVLLIPSSPDAPCSVNGQHVTEPTYLAQGAVILIGQTNMFRFNHPAQAAKLRKEFKGVDVISVNQPISSVSSIRGLFFTFSVEFELESLFSVESVDDGLVPIYRQPSFRRNHWVRLRSKVRGTSDAAARETVCKIYSVLKFL